MPMYRLVVNQDDPDSIATSGNLEESYRMEIEELIKNESERRITENKDPLEGAKLSFRKFPKKYWIVPGILLVFFLSFC